METTSPQWCHRCCRFIPVWPDAVICPDCGGDFLDPPSLSAQEPRRRRIPSGGDDSTDAFGQPRQTSEIRFRRSGRASSGDRSPFNPVIVLRGPPQGGQHDAERVTTGSFELYYDDGNGSGLRPLPESMSDFLMGSGFERLLDQLAQIEVNGAGGGRGFEHPPASKAAIDSMPIVEITDDHVVMETHCAICKDLFELGADAREMPCEHIYHKDCILPWLSLRNSCPVCRHEMPTDAQEQEVEAESHVAGNDEEMVGLTIWRLPGGGFAVGRFSGGRRAGERELPVVYTEMDGGFNNNGAPRRISWSLRGSRSRRSGGIDQAFRNFFSFFRRLRSSPSTLIPWSTSQSRSSSTPSLRQRSYSFFSRSSRRRSTNWSLDEGNVNAIARW